MKRGEKMNRAKIQEYIDQREEQRVDLYHYEEQSENDFLLNGHQYKLLKNYREGFDGEQLANRFSNVLNKYDYIVGDWGYDQLRLKGFYDLDNPLFRPEQELRRLKTTCTKIVILVAHTLSFKTVMFACLNDVIGDTEKNILRQLGSGVGNLTNQSHGSVVANQQNELKLVITNKNLLSING